MEGNVTASATKHRRTTLERIDKFISDKYFTDVNLYGQLYPHRVPANGIKHWKVPGGVGSWMDWPFEKMKAKLPEFKDVAVGDSFGPSWSTHWFKIDFEVPDSWEGKEVRVRFKSDSEALIWSVDGEPLQGLSSGTSFQPRPEFVVSPKWNLGQPKLQYMVEMAGSRMFGVGKGGMINPPDPDQKFTLEAVELVVLDREAFSLFLDLQVLHDFAKTLENDQRGFRALYAANQMINDIINGDRKSAAEVSKTFFSRKNGENCTRLALLGHCHIDSAWLWPFSETMRKCARSWSAVVRLMDDFPDMVFACSQAQQYAWVKEHYPALFQKIKEKNQKGKFVHVGATWVEMDGLMPSGESFIRQFLYGQKFYFEEFGSESRVFWLPDTFGYSAQLPQICRHFGIGYMLTQKLSWNLVNDFPHHSFIWEGIDGTSVLTHFPPGDSYEMTVKPSEALKTDRNCRDKGRVDVAGFLYGYGDGGGGPTEQMLERAKRLANVDGCPRMEHMSPIALFGRLESQRRNMNTWVGELYLELHNGTYTSQAKTKKFNRKCELELRCCEILLSKCLTQKAMKWKEAQEKRVECETEWKKVLLNQFHDVIPGSSIALVYQDSDKLYQEVLAKCQQIRESCIKKLSAGEKSSSQDMWVLNSLPWEVQQIIQLPSGVEIVEVKDLCIQSAGDGGTKRYVAVLCPAMCFTKLTPESVTETSDSLLIEARLLTPPKVVIEKHGRDFSMENQFLYVYLTHLGEITRMRLKSAPGADPFNTSVDGSKGNVLTLYDDVPLYWDAWDIMDYHEETRTVLNTSKNEYRIKPLSEVESGPLKAVLAFEIDLGSKGSHCSQRIVMTAVDPYLTFVNKVTWKESHKLLKVEFETNVRAKTATYEIQFGHIERPAHRNTSWDWAKYEVSGHKWANVSEFNRGVTVMNDCKYGWSCKGGTLILSLLRAPKAPDDTCDMGDHEFKYAVMPHRGTFQQSGCIEASYEFNAPVQAGPGAPKGGGVSRWMTVLGSGVMVEAAKIAEGSNPGVVARLYEMYGGSSHAWLKLSFKAIKAFACFGNEITKTELKIHDKIPDDKHPDEKSCYIEIQMLPFEIKTIKVVPK